MKPVCPRQPHADAKLITIAEDQPQYTPLTISRDAQGLVMSEWEPTPEERDMLAAGARVRLWTHTFNTPFQPVQLEVTGPDSAALMHPLVALARRVAAANQKWWEDINTGAALQRNVGELLMLVVSELAEGMEGDRKNLPDDKLPHRRMFDVEMIDAIIRLLDIAGHLIGDCAGEIFEEKMVFNAVRKDHTREHRLTNNGKKY